MRCNNCGVEMFIVRTGVVPEGDNSPETETKVWNVPYYKCMNGGCTQYGVEVEGERVLIYI